MSERESLNWIPTTAAEAIGMFSKWRDDGATVQVMTILMRPAEGALNIATVSGEIDEVGADTLRVVAIKTFDLPSAYFRAHVPLANASFSYQHYSEQEEEPFEAAVSIEWPGSQIVFAVQCLRRTSEVSR